MRKYPIRYCFNHLTVNGWKWLESARYGDRCITEWSYWANGAKNWRMVYILFRGDHVMLSTATKQHETLGIRTV